ncbi:hypothetical protein [Plantibacter flavus]|nr:hypothetical protein [Plantibacter flavus]
MHQTTFGNELTVTVNFGADDHASSPAECSVAPLANAEQTFCIAD